MIHMKIDSIYMHKIYTLPFLEDYKPFSLES